MKTSLTIVAHPDDDLLFFNPDILLDLLNGIHPVVIFVTYGNDGHINSDYWERKVKATRNVYPLDLTDLIWIGVQSNSANNNNPCGDLYKMYQDEKYETPDTYGKRIDKAWLMQELEYYITFFKPSVIRTHNPNRQPAIDKDEPELDHIDHIYTGKFVLEAAKQFPLIPVYAYEGYPIRYQAPNVSPELAEAKKVMWRKYQEIDTEVSGEIWDTALDKCYKEQVQ